MVKTLWSLWNDLIVDENILNKINRQGSGKRLVVPMKERRTMLEYCHEKITSGHLGVKKTLGRLKTKFYWPGMKQDVIAYIGGCETCAKGKGPVKKEASPLQLQKSGFPKERIAVDILGELPTTEKGSKFVW